MTEALPRRPRLPVLLLLGTATLLPACVEGAVDPQLDRYAVRVYANGSFQDVDLGQDQDTGPFPALDVTMSRMVEREGTRVTELEAGVRQLDLGVGTPFDGVARGVLVGARRTWHLERRLRPVAMVGLTMTRFNFSDRSADANFTGPGGYVGAGLLYSLTPCWHLGLETRAHLHHWDGHGFTSWNTGVDAGLSLTYRF